MFRSIIFIHRALFFRYNNQLYLLIINCDESLEIVWRNHFRNQVQDTILLEKQEILFIRNYISIRNIIIQSLSGTLLYIRLSRKNN